MLANLSLFPLGIAGQTSWLAAAPLAQSTVRQPASTRSGRTTAAGRCLRSGVAVWLLLQSPQLVAQQKRNPSDTASSWEVLHDCRLVTNSVVDGDSFHVSHQDRDYIFRLYFVDAPESNSSITNLLRDQAAYFGILAEDIPRAGKLAARFTRDQLAATGFTVITRWQNALGRSSLARYYAVVLVHGKNLAEELVASGLARIHGLRANWPDGPAASTFLSKLKNLELSARERKLGIWDETKFPRVAAGGTDPPKTAKAKPPETPVDLNTASYEELLTLPGVRPKLAERIMAHRPYRKIEDLDSVPGVGPATMKRLTPLIRVGGLPDTNPAGNGTP